MYDYHNCDDDNGNNNNNNDNHHHHHHHHNHFNSNMGNQHKHNLKEVPFNIELTTCDNFAFNDLFLYHVNIAL